MFADENGNNTIFDATGRMIRDGIRVAQNTAGSILSDVDDDDLRSLVKTNEKDIDYFYNDHKGNVTIGYGFMVPRASEARRLNLERRLSNGAVRPATESEITGAYYKVRSGESGRHKTAEDFNPDTYKEFDNVRMSPSYMNELLDNRLKHTARELRNGLSEFDTYPKSARKGLIDMQYNMGASKFNRSKWPNLFEAVEKRDWSRAAQESRRRDVGDERNKDTYDLFIKATEE